MDLVTAKAEALRLIAQDVKARSLPLTIDPVSPDGDPAKFMLEGKPARMANPHNGQRVKVSPSWWRGGLDMPELSGGPFYWYVFVLRNRQGNVVAYYICDYVQMRTWVQSFQAPRGDDHQDHADWGADVTTNSRGETVFRWQDEHQDALPPGRVIQLNNVHQLPATPGLPPPAPPPSFIPVTYSGFGQAPDDDVGALQRFARKVRRGQPKFRQNLLKLYDGRCAITDEGPSDVLEAAHILLHSLTGLNHTDNGLLLRADLHILFDVGLLRIEPSTRAVWLSPKLKKTSYASLEGKVLRARPDGGPSQAYLEMRWKETAPV